jgi:predicted amidohydrolase
MSDDTISNIEISLLQHNPTPLDIDASLIRLEQAASESAAHGSSLLLTPECGITGYDMSNEDAQIAAFAKDSAIAKRIAQIARQYSIAIVYGFMELSGQQRYNSVQLIDDNGEILLHYRKTHLWGNLDQQLFSAGDKLPEVVSYKGWRLSTLICYDVEFPETVRSLALAGAQLVLVPTALMQPFRFVAEQMIAVRAAENQIFLAYANLVGQERNTIYEGRSTVADPDGNLLTSASSYKAMLLHCKLQTDTITTSRQALPYHQDRRPELYTALTDCSSLDYS